MSDADKIERLMLRYGAGREAAETMVDRQKVYGDPFDNHQNIANIWAGLMQPWVHRIAQCKPLPPHVVAMMMAGLKMSRMRMTFHADNFLDVGVYLNFARVWQSEWAESQKNGRAMDTPVLIPVPENPDEYELVIEWRKKS